MEKTAKTLRRSDQRESFLKDLNSLSDCWSQDCFAKVSSLFVEKWSAVPSAQVPLEHFKKIWLSERVCRFYRGSAEGYVMNNNGLEATNRVLKDTGTFHELIPIMQFLPAMTTFIGDQSFRRNPQNINTVKFSPLRPDINLKDMTDGYLLMTSQMRFITVNEHLIAVDSNRIGNEPFDQAMADSIYTQYTTCKWDSMDHFNSFQLHVHVITPQRSCNCHEFGNNFKCCHVMCLEMLVDNIAVPDSAKTVPLGTKRKPGRPRKAVGRYKIQDYRITAPDAGSEGKLNFLIKLIY